MDKIKLLETQRVLRELEFIETDYQYRKEVVNSADPEFLNQVNLFLTNNPELKEKYDSKVSEIFFWKISIVDPPINFLRQNRFFLILTKN